MGLAILSILDSCPNFYTCCFCLSLRPGVLCGACVGFFWGTLHLFAYSPLGVEVLKEFGLPKIVCATRSVRLFHYALGVLLCAGHGLLFGATLSRNSALSLLYAGSATVLASILLVLGPAVSLSALALGLVKLSVAFVTPIMAIFAAVALLYLAAIVVNYCSTLPNS